MIPAAPLNINRVDRDFFKRLFIDDSLKLELGLHNLHQATELRDGNLETVDLTHVLKNIDVIFGSPRVSTHPQARTGYSKDIVQQQDCVYWGTQLGLPVECHNIHFGESGRSSEQAYLHAALCKAQEHGRAAVMRWSLPRLLRPRLGSNQLDKRDLEDIAKYGVPILSAMPFNVSENFLRSRMSKLIAAYKKRRGEQYAPTTYIPADAAPKILELSREGIKPPTITRVLKELGFTTKHKKPWNRQQVKRVIEALQNLGIETLEQLHTYLMIRDVTEGLKSV